jgi:hypothetical protein
MIDERRQPPRTTPRPPWDFSPPDVEDIVETHRRARAGHRILSDHLVMVGDHDPEPRYRFVHFFAAGRSAYGPSDATRWLDCPGAPRIPKVRTSAHRNKEEAARLQAAVAKRMKENE